MFCKRYFYTGFVLLLSFVFSAINAEPDHKSFPYNKVNVNSHLVILAAGGWKGNFATDSFGRGGIGALYSYVQSERALLRSEGGRLILLYSGNLTGKKTVKGFQKFLSLTPKNKKNNLLNYFYFDGISPSSEEFFLFSQSGFRFRSPLIAFNIRNSLFYKNLYKNKKNIHKSKNKKRKKIKSIRPQMPEFIRKIKYKDISINITSLVCGEEPYFDGQAFSRLKPLFYGQKKKAEILNVLLLNASSHCKYIQEGFLKKLLPNPKNPFHIIPYSNKLIVIRAGAPQNLFFVRSRKIPVCEIHGRTLCRIDLIFRNGKVVSMRQKFIDLNGIQAAMPWVKPDLLLSQRYNHKN